MRACPPAVQVVGDAPPELSLVAIMRVAPPAPWLAPEVHGQPIVMLVACDTGPLAQAEERLAPIKALTSSSIN